MRTVRTIALATGLVATAGCQSAKEPLLAQNIVGYATEVYEQGDTQPIPANVPLECE